MVLDGAGWHTADDLRVHANVAPVPMPTCPPELNPVERTRLFLRERHLSRRNLDDYAVVEGLCRAWNAPTKASLRSTTNYPYLERVRIQPGRYDSSDRPRTAAARHRGPQSEGGRLLVFGYCPGG